MDRRPGGFLLAMALLVAVSPLAAQEEAEADETSLIQIQGEVLDALTGRPLPDVMVVMHDLWQFTRTDTLGYFSFADVPAGEHDLGVYALGYISVEGWVAFDSPLDVYAVNLEPAPMQIEGLQVDLLSRGEVEYRSFGQRFDYVGPELMKVYRERYGVITDMIRARFPALRVVDMGGPGAGICILMMRRSTSPSEMNPQCAAMFIDGLPATGEDVRALHPDVIESIRFLQRLEARLIFGDLGSHGALLIETRTGR